MQKNSYQELKMDHSIFRRSDGYTFIELLVAITILGFLVAPFLSLFSTAYSAITVAADQTEATNLCRDQIEWVKAQGFAHFYPPGSDNRQITIREDALPANPGYSRVTELAIQSFNPPGHPDLEVEVLHITVTASWTAFGREHSEKVESYLAER